MSTYGTPIEYAKGLRDGESDSAKLRTMIQELIDAAQAVVNSWERGDLAGAVSALDGTADEACTLIGYTPTDGE